jgi:hypothetical protein
VPTTAYIKDTAEIHSVEVSELPLLSADGDDADNEDIQDMDIFEVFATQK